MRARWRPTLLVLTGLALAGCSGHPTPVAVPSPSGSATSTITATPATPATPSIPATPTIPATPATGAPTPAGGGPTTCPAGALALAVGTTQGAAGTLYQSILLTNTGSAPCTLDGYPGVSFLDSAGAQLGPAAARAAGQSPQLVTLVGGGGIASFTLALHNAESYDPARCRPQPTATLRVYPPDLTAALTVSDQTSVCTRTYNSTEVGVVVVGPTGGPV